MPVYNNVSFIVQSIDSVQQQEYREWELLIIDDGSSVDVRSVLGSFLCDSRIHYERLAVNQGVAAARNRGIALARGRYLAFLDSDDLWLPDKLAKQLKFMKVYHAAISCTAYRRFQGTVADCGKIIQVPAVIDYRDLLKGNVIGCLTVIMDRQMIGEIYMPSRRHEDYITWLNIAQRGFEIYGLQEDLARYRESEASLTSNKWRSLQWTWQVYRESQRLSIRRSLYYMIYYVIKGLQKRI